MPCGAAPSRRCVCHFTTSAVDSVFCSNDLSVVLRRVWTGLRRLHPLELSAKIIVFNIIVLSPSTATQPD
jgi:hypothetical protein